LEGKSGELRQVLAKLLKMVEYPRLIEMASRLLKAEKLTQARNNDSGEKKFNEA